MDENPPALFTPDLIGFLAPTLRSLAGQPLSLDAQAELAALMDLLPEVEAGPGMTNRVAAEMVAMALHQSPPVVSLAKELNENLRRQLRPSWLAAMRSSPSAIVIIGLGFLLYLALPLIFLGLPRLIEYGVPLGVDLTTFILVGLAGALGSVVSIMIRIHTFTKTGLSDSLALFLTGFFKPVIGTAFALFAFCAINSGLVPVTVNPEKAKFFFAALGFVVGFSERFARDVTKKVEDALG